MLETAATGEFPRIDLGDYARGDSRPTGTCRTAVAARAREHRFLDRREPRDPGRFDRWHRRAGTALSCTALRREDQIGDKAGNGAGFTGYLPSGEYAIRTSRINDNDQPDVNAAFFMDRERAPDDPEVLAGKLFREPNKWPADLPGFREFLLRYWEAVEAFARRLLPAFAVALDLPPQAFDRAFEDAQCVLRLSHFPPAQYRNNQFGLAPHTDANFFTVLPQSNVEGLYIRPGRRSWLKAPRIPGSLIINSGDMCRRWTE